MDDEDPSDAGDREPPTPMRPARLFAVRLWTEDLADSPEYRGSVRDVRTNAFRAFRDWSDLVAFIVTLIEQHERRGHRRTDERDDHQ